MSCVPTASRRAECASPGVRLGFDLVQISQIDNSLSLFGEAFRRRLFTRHELDYADSGAALASERLAARFAAKEAVIKALKLCNAGVAWRDIEVVRGPDGDCTIALHGRAAACADAMGLTSLVPSLSHDGDYAGAVVVALFADAVVAQTPFETSDGSSCGAS